MSTRSRRAYRLHAFPTSVRLAPFGRFLFLPRGPLLADWCHLPMDLPLRSELRALQENLGMPRHGWPYQPPIGMVFSHIASCLHLRLFHLLHDIPQVSRSWRCSAWVGHPCDESVRIRTWISLSCSCRSVNRSPPVNVQLTFSSQYILLQSTAASYRDESPCTPLPSLEARRH